MPKPTKRIAYQVVREDTGRWRNPIGHKGRLLSKRRANRVCKFLLQRGHDVSIRLFGTINVYPGTRLFD